MRTGIVLIALLSIFTLAGCGRSESKDQSSSKSSKSSGGVADQYLGGMEKIAVAVEGIENEADARKAAQVIASVAGQMEKMTATLEAMSDAEKTAIYARRSTDFQKVQMRLSTAMQSLATQPDLLRIVADEMQKMPEMK